MKPDTMEPRGDITEVLDRLIGGDRDALSELLPLIQDELRVFAARYMKSERHSSAVHDACVESSYRSCTNLSSLDFAQAAH